MVFKRDLCKKVKKGYKNREFLSKRLSIDINSVSVELDYPLLRLIQGVISPIHDPHGFLYLGRLVRLLAFSSCISKVHRQTPSTRVHGPA
jgi:hypothetical protein